MPDLSSKGSHEFWQKFPNPAVYKAVAFMEGIETWTADGDPAVENAMLELGDALDKIGSIDLQAEEKFIKISDGIKFGRALRLLQCMDAAHPGAASKILSFAELNSTPENQAPALFLQRNIVFERLRLLGRIFAKEHMDAISKVLEAKTK